MTLDPILAEVRRIREEYAQQFNGDVHAMMDDLRRRHVAAAYQADSEEQSPNCETTPIPVDDAK